MSWETPRGQEGAVRYLPQDREGQLTYGDRKKQDWYFTSKAVVAMANIALTAPSVCCLGLGYPLSSIALPRPP